MSSQDDRVPELRHNPEQNRYELRFGDEVAGVADYVLGDGVISFTHTKIDASYEGRGLAGQLVKYALDDVRAADQHKVLAVCPYVERWIQRHEGYRDLLYDVANQ